MTQSEEQEYQETHTPEGEHLEYLMEHPEMQQTNTLPELILSLALDASVEGMYGDKAEEFKEKIRVIIAQALQEAVKKEHQVCKKVYIEGVDWSEWAISDEEAAENFEGHYKEAVDALSPSEGEQV